MRMTLTASGPSAPIILPPGRHLLTIGTFDRDLTVNARLEFSPDGDLWYSFHGADLVRFNHYVSVDGPVTVRADLAGVPSVPVLLATYPLPS